LASKCHNNRIAVSPRGIRNERVQIEYDARPTTRFRHHNVVDTSRTDIDALGCKRQPDVRQVDREARRAINRERLRLWRWTGSLESNLDTLSVLWRNLDGRQLRTAGLGWHDQYD
jgi:hypothetical protein